MRRAAPLLLLLALALAGCGGSGDSSSKSETSKSAEQIADDAQQAAKSARAVHVAGSVAQDSGQFAVDMRIVKNVGAKGEMDVKDGHVGLVRVGSTIYMKGNSAFWRSIGSDIAGPLLKDRWIRVPAGQKGLEGIDRFTDLDRLAGTLGAHGEISKKGTRTYRGRKVIVLEDSSDAGGTLYVAASGKPYPLAIVSPNGGKEGLIAFDDWNKVVAIAAPKGAVDLSKLGGGG